MVAYSFKERFVTPILAGLGERVNCEPGDGHPRPKSQTIRAPRRRHARPGEQLQLYTKMRTKHCRLIGRATCTNVREITIAFAKPRNARMSVVTVHDECDQVWTGAALDDFAQRDGFADWEEMRLFWQSTHETKKRPTLKVFRGVLIEWEPDHQAK